MKWQGKRQSDNVTVLTDEQNKGNQGLATRYQGGLNANRLLNEEPIAYSDEGSQVERNLKSKGLLNPGNNKNSTRKNVSRPLSGEADQKFLKHTEKDILGDGFN